MAEVDMPRLEFIDGLFVGFAAGIMLIALARLVL
jgi:hypothetical protein